MSTHNICFRGEIRKIFTGYPPLSRPMTRYIVVACFLFYFFFFLLITFFFNQKC